jgi:O-antigen ligase
MPFQRRSRWQLVGLGMLAVQLIGIYLSGFRGLWYSLAVFLVSYALVRRRGWIVIGVGIAGLPLLPVEFMQRLLSLFDIRYADSSQFARLDRATQAFNLMTSSPIMGLGWGGSGYVHSDLIQIGANLGVPALATFIAWILSQLWQFFQLSKRSDWMGEQASILFAALCGLSFVFAGEGLIVWAQFMVPIWFLFAMGYKLVDLAEKEEGNA